MDFILLSLKVAGKDAGKDDTSFLRYICYSIFGTKGKCLLLKITCVGSKSVMRFEEIYELIEMLQIRVAC